MTIFELEHNDGDKGKVKIIDSKEWKHEVPVEVFKVAQDAHQERIPVLVGHHDDFGYYVLMSGQGPFIAYAENESLYDLNRVEEQY